MLFKAEIAIISVMIVWTVVELIRAVIWEIEDIINNYKGKGGEEDVHGEDWQFDSKSS